MKKIFLFILPLYLFAADLKKDIYIYDEYVGSSHFQTRWELLKKADKIVIKGFEKNKSIEIETSPSLNFEKYSFKGKKNFDAFLKGSYLYVTEIDGKKRIKKSYKLKKYPWIPQLSFGLRPFFLSSKKRLTFYLIDPKKLTPRRLVVKKGKNEILKIKGKKYNTKKVTLTLPGAKSIFWSASIWYDIKTGDFLKYKGKNGSKKTVTILSSKKLE